MIAKQDKNHNSRKGNDGRSISVDWWRSQGRNLQYTLTQRKEMERQAQDLRLSEGLAELGILKSLEGKIIGYLKAEEEFSPELARYSSFRIDLDQAREVATTLTTIIQEKVRDYNKYVRRRIITVVPKLQEEEREQKKEQAEQPEQDGQQPKKQRAVEELAHLCQNYASLEQLDVRVIPRTLLNPYVRDVGELAGLASREVQGIKERYLAASTVEEITALKTELEETVVGPFLRKRDQLQQKYSFRYTARIFPCWREYRALGMEMSKEWQELRGEMETVARNSETFLRQRQDLEKATKELQQLAGEIPAPELNGGYLETIRGLQQRAEKLHYSSLPTKFRYLSEAANHYKAAWETMHTKLSKAATSMHELMEGKLGELEARDYLHPQDLEEGLSQLQHISTVASLESYSLQPGSAPASSPLSTRARQLEQKLQKASLGIKQFSSVVGLQTYLHTSVEKNGWPADTIVPNNIPINGAGANTALERSTLYALIIGADAQGYHLPGTLWQRVEQLGVRPNKVVDLIALAAEYVLPVETGATPRETTTAVKLPEASSPPAYTTITA